MNTRLKKFLIFVGVGIVSFVLILSYFIIPFIRLEFLKSKVVAGELKLERDTVLPIGIRQDVYEKMFETKAYKRIESRLKTEEQKKTLRSLTIFGAVAGQGMIDEEDRDLAINHTRNHYIYLACAVYVYGEGDGFALARGQKLIDQNTDERKVKIFTSGKNMAFAVISFPDLDKEECLKKFNNDP